MKRPSVADAKPAATYEIDHNLVRALAELLTETDLSEIEVEKGDLHIRVARHSSVAAPAPVFHQAAAPAVSAPAAMAAPVAASAKAADPESILKSPMVGTAFRRPNPDAKAFVDVGTSVKVGDRVLLVEAMKTFNEIVAHRSGTVTSILIEDGQPVEYGQTLMTIE
jgi:acetyl-CoA carboxylase biotin carboxyl carrier protein